MEGSLKKNSQMKALTNQHVGWISQYLQLNFQLFLMIVVQLVVMKVGLIVEYFGNGHHVQNVPLHNTLSEVVESYHDLKNYKEI